VYFDCLGWSNHNIDTNSESIGGTGQSENFGTIGSLPQNMPEVGHDRILFT
jgi:hypothetical protein